MEPNPDEYRRDQADLDEAVLALREALAELEAGEKGQPFEEFFRECRAARGFSAELPEN